MIDTTLYYTITQYATRGLWLQPPHGLGRTSTSSQFSPLTSWPMPIWWRTSAPSQTSEASCRHPPLKNPHTLKSRGLRSGELGAQIELLCHLPHVIQWGCIWPFVFTALTTLGVLPNETFKDSKRAQGSSWHSLFPWTYFQSDRLTSCWPTYTTPQRPWGVISASRKFAVASRFVSTTSNCCMILKCDVFSVSYTPNLSGNTKIASPACLV